MLYLDRPSTDLSIEDRAMVNRLRGLFEKSPSGERSTGLKRILSSGFKRNDLRNRFDWDRAYRTVEGIRIPGLPRGRADALLVSPEELNKRGSELTPLAPKKLMAFGDLGNNVLHILDPKATIERFEAANRSAKGSPKSEHGAALFQPLKPFSEITIEEFLGSLISHEVCHLDGDPKNLVSNKNSEVTCYTKTLNELSDLGFFAKQGKINILSFVAGAYDQTVWARELLILMDGKFDETTRKILPGGKKFVAALTEWIERTEFELQSKTDEDDKLSAESALMLFKDAIAHPTGCYYTKVLTDMVVDQLVREFDAKSSKFKSSITLVAYVEKRRREYIDYLNGDRATFQLEKFRSPPRSQRLKADASK